MIGDILDIARVDDKNLVLEMSPTDLDGLVGETVHEAQLGGQQAGIVIEVAALDDRTIDGDAPRLRRVGENLLSNALKVTPPGGAGARHRAEAQ